MPASGSQDKHFVEKYVVPSLVFLLIVASGFGFRSIVGRLDSIDASNGIQERNITTIQSDVRDINTRLDMGVIRQVNDNKTVLAEHEKRLQRLERAVRVP